MSSSSLTVGDVARKAGIAASAVRYYEKIGLLPQAERVGSWRRFPEAVVDRLAVIAVATDAGFSLAEVGVLLDAADDDRGSGAIQALAKQKLPELQATLKRTELLILLMKAAGSCACPAIEECARRARAAGL